jgi:hypothetical protein
VQDVEQRGNYFMSAEPIRSEQSSLPVPPSYEQCVVEPTGSRADYVASPLEMAALFDWDDEDDC